MLLAPFQVQQRIVALSRSSSPVWEVGLTDFGVLLARPHQPAVVLLLAAAVVVVVVTTILTAADYTTVSVIAYITHIVFLF